MAFSTQLAKKKATLSGGLRGFVMGLTGNLVGETGFEPAAPCTPCRCATKLRHSPTLR